MEVQFICFWVRSEAHLLFSSFWLPQFIILFCCFNMNLKAALVGVLQLCYSNCFSALSCFSGSCTRAQCGWSKPVKVLRNPWHIREPGLSSLHWRCSDMQTARREPEFQVRCAYALPSPPVSLQMMGKDVWQLSLTSALIVSSRAGMCEGEEQV